MVKRTWRYRCVQKIASPEALESLFGKTTLELIELLDDGSINQAGYVFSADVVLNETTSLTSNISSYPVEKNAPTTDGATVNPLEFSFSGIVSDASMTYIGVVDDIAGSTLGQSFEAQSRSSEAYNILKTWIDEGIPLKLVNKFASDGVTDAKGRITPFFISSL